LKQVPQRCGSRTPDALSIALLQQALPWRSSNYRFDLALENLKKLWEKGSEKSPLKKGVSATTS